MALPSSSDWASLPVNLLHSILDYLVPMEDYLTFSEICIQWQYAVCEKLQHLRSNHKRHYRLHEKVPLLMAPTADKTFGRSCLYDVQGKVLVQLQWSRLGQWRFDGSSRGWFILVDRDSYKVMLHNPFSVKFIHLPPLEKNLFFEYLGKVWKRSFPSRRRGVLSIDPDVNGGEFVLMMTCGGLDGEKDQSIAFIKSGEEDWTYIQELRDVDDIVYSNGLFYVLDHWGALFSCDVSNGFKVRRITSTHYVGDLPSYLVESPEGDLLRVVKKSPQDRPVIYKLAWFSRNPRWKKIRSLGEVALFLGDNHSTSVIAYDRDFAGCRPNSIYFNEHGYGPNLSEKTAYIYDLNDKTVTPLYLCTPSPPSPLLWISPKYPSLSFSTL